MSQIGTMRDDGYLVKRGRQAVLFRRFDGFGIGVGVLDRIKGLEVHYKGKTYTADRQAFRENGVLVDYSGYETQLVLGRKHFNEVK